jgi:hypothetical protein
MDLQRFWITGRLSLVYNVLPTPLSEKYQILQLIEFAVESVSNEVYVTTHAGLSYQTTNGRSVHTMPRRC